MYFLIVLLCLITLNYGGFIVKTVRVNGTEISPVLSYPDYFDWRDYKAVTPVKNQLTCEACAAFSVVANIESAWKISSGTLETMSEQFVIDCVYGEDGCGDTASIIETFANIVTATGGVLRDEDYYKYTARQYECRWTSTPGRPKLVPVIGFKRVYPDEKKMASALFTNGPLSAGINSASMAKYTGGIDEPQDSDCDPTKLNHAILIVGYSAYVDRNTGKVTPYWIIKNSWGTEWGDRGYYYLVRGRNACGIATDVSFAYVG